MVASRTSAVCSLQQAAAAVVRFCYCGGGGGFKAKKHGWKTTTLVICEKRIIFRKIRVRTTRQQLLVKSHYDRRFCWSDFSGRRKSYIERKTWTSRTSCPCALSNPYQSIVFNHPVCSCSCDTYPKRTAAHDARSRFCPSSVYVPCSVFGVRRCWPLRDVLSLYFTRDVRSNPFLPENLFAVITLF